MSHRIRFTEEARADIKRLYAFALDASDDDWSYAERTIETIGVGIEMLTATPFVGRKAAAEVLHRELVIGFGSAGFVVLYEVEDGEVVTIIAVRHQREDDYR
ncbi:MAG: type II toxin-antitoxin system RelE/ParE family toxin [Thermomonas sp.]